MSLPLDRDLKFGVFPNFQNHADAKAKTEMADRLGFDSLWVGDHLVFTGPIMDSLTQLAMAAAFSDRLMLGTGIFLLPLRHPTPVAKQVSTLDRLSDGRVIFGVGIGGEFPVEFQAAGVPVEERGARLSEGITVLKKFWSGQPVSNDGRFYPFGEAKMAPPPLQPGGPPIWCGGRAPAALTRTGCLADGYLSYVITPEMFADALAKIEEAADNAGREIERFGTGHLLFARIDDSHEQSFAVANEHLSTRYAMDFSRATERYAALGRPEDVAERIAEYYDAGVRHIVYDPVSPADQAEEQHARFAEEVMPLLRQRIGG